MKNKIIYRNAVPEDSKAIAELHVTSWQNTYRGMWSDKFLDETAPEKQLLHWTKTLSVKNNACQLIVAEQESKIIGFAFTKLDENPRWGALLDNLHVSKEYRGLGIGKKLLKISADWVLSQNPASNYYLWVLEDNHSARDFYKKRGGKEVEFVTESSEALGSYKSVRCFWKNGIID